MTKAWIMFALLTLVAAAVAKAEQAAVFLDTPFHSKAGQAPACTSLSVKDGKKKATVRDTNKSWAKTKINAKAFSSLRTFTDLGSYLNAVDSYQGRFTDKDVQNLMLRNLTPGMPYEFAFMLLDPSDSRSVNNYADPVSGDNKTFTYHVWNNSKKSEMFGAALSVAGAATGLGGIVGSVSAVQAGTVAVTAASTAYSIESLRAYKFVTIGVDEKLEIQSFSSN
jgi:hypothetical protein